EVTDEAQDGIVQSQTPAAGEKAKPGSTVVIQVGQLAPDRSLRP
ncbi:MAG: PASTA domain-containing protein, partial [Actinobacteria bacterium]|nr:PASTA domain-containing protein [Actinomycetota bacterium]